MVIGPTNGARRRRQLIACRAGVVLLVLVSQAMLVAPNTRTLGDQIRSVSFMFTAAFIYANLTTVRVEVRELFEHPVVFRCQEFFWLSMIIFVSSFLLS